MDTEILIQKLLELLKECGKSVYIVKRSFEEEENSDENLRLVLGIYLDIDNDIIIKVD